VLVDAALPVLGISYRVHQFREQEVGVLGRFGQL